MVNHSKPFDIIVVGAGPGGASAAIHAAENGYSVCLLEKEPLGITGRYKACGGAIDWKMVEALAYPEEKIARVIDSLELHHLDGESYSKKGEGAVVWRSVFDKYLADVAVAHGVVIKDDEPLVAIEKQGPMYTISTTKEKYQATYVLASDGISSPTLRKLDWPRFPREDLILTITQEMKISKQTIAKFLGHSSLHLFFSIKSLSHLGYAWLFPKIDRITVGWGNQLIRINKSREEFNLFLNMPFVKDLLKNSTTERFKGHLIPVSVRPQLFKENVYAVGDAGGLVDPISGKGIPYAIESGQIAINTIKLCENKGVQYKQGHYYEETLGKDFLQLLREKRVARDRIYQNDQTLKQFLTLWEKHRSSEIVRRGLI